MNISLLPKACRSVSSFSKKFNPAFNIAHYETSNSRRSTLESLPKYNNVMNSIFKYSFKSYSTNVNTSVLVEEYSKLSTEQVYTLLRTAGPKLNEQSIIQLKNIGFDAYSLTSIIIHLQEDTDKYKVVDKFVHDNIVVQHVDMNVHDNAKTKLKDVILLVVIWMEDLITKLKIKTSIGIIKYDILEQFRNGKEYSYLRNLTNPKKMNELETMIGKNIILPNLSLIDSELIPKDFQPFTPYLLTKQRFQLLKYIVEEYINKPIYSNGLIPYGPHGISKSYTIYLIVCYAIVNSFPILYIPKCTSWVSIYGNNMNEEAADTYLVQQFFRLNGDLLENTNGLFNNCTFFKECNFISIRKEIFTICGGSSVNSSKFEGYEFSRLTDIQPPTEMEFKILISNYEMDPNDYNRIEYVTGRIPSSLKDLQLKIKGFMRQDKPYNKELISDSIFNNFINEQKLVFLKRLNCLNIEFNEKEKQEFTTIIIDLFSNGFSNNNNNNIKQFGKVHSFLIDLGIIYYDSNYNLTYLNESAKRALIEYYNIE